MPSFPSLTGPWLIGGKPVAPTVAAPNGPPLTAHLKAFLVRLKEGLIYTKQLRDFLFQRPLLVIELGFVLKLDWHADYGFDSEDTLPTRFWLGEKLRQLDRALLQELLAATVTALKEEIPGLGEKEINDEAGGRARLLMDRTSPLYKAVYTQRTSCERIDSQAKELGIERPRVHNRHSVANLNTLIYLVINVRVLQRAKSIHRGLLQIH